MPNDRPEIDLAQAQDVAAATLQVIAEPGKRVHFQVTPVARKPLCKQNDYLGRSHKRFTKDESLVACAKCLAGLQRLKEEASERALARAKPGPRPAPAPRRKDHLVGMKVDSATEERIAAMAKENGESVAAFLRRAVDNEMRAAGPGQVGYSQLNRGFAQVIEELDRRVPLPIAPYSDSPLPPSLDVILEVARRVDDKVTRPPAQLDAVLAALAQVQKALVVLAAGQARHDKTIEGLVGVFGALGATDDVGADLAPAKASESARGAQTDSVRSLNVR